MIYILHSKVVAEVSENVHEVSIQLDISPQEFQASQIRIVPVHLEHHVEIHDMRVDDESCNIEFIYETSCQQVQFVLIDKTNTIIVSHILFDHATNETKTINNFPLAMTIPDLHTSIIHYGGISQYLRPLKTLLKSLRASPNGNGLLAILLNMLLAVRLTRVEADKYRFFSYIDKQTITPMTPERAKYLFGLSVNTGHITHIGEGVYQVSDPSAHVVLWADIKGSLGMPVALQSSVLNNTLTVCVEGCHIVYLPTWVKQADEIAGFLESIPMVSS